MKKIINIIIAFVLISALYGQNNDSRAITYNGTGNYELTERTDLRRYDNGRYTGLVSREVSSFIIPIENEDGFLYDGRFFILENTKHDLRNVAQGLNDAIPSVFKIDRFGKLSMIEDHGFPSYRSFPTFPNKPISLGDTWEGKAERAVDPLNKGIVTKMPVYVQYTYTGDSVFYNEPVYVISAKWATRYGMGSGNYYIDWGGDQDLEKASGSHSATIYVTKAGGNAVLIRDNVNETFTYSDGNNITFKGTVNLFTKYPPAIDRLKLLPALKRVADLSDAEVEALAKPVKDEYIAMNQSKDTEEWEKVDLDYVEQPVSKSEKDKTELGFSKSEKELIEDAFSKSEKVNSGINVKVDNTVAGIRLTIENLNFQPDSSELVAGDYSKLDDIAEILKTVPEGKFLIEGHTASTGNLTGETKLSLERAEAIRDQFVARGLQTKQFVCRGAGSGRPVASNETREGKAKNRRVEITILE